MKLTTLKPRLAVPLERLNTIKPGSWRNDKQTSTQRGYGYKWQKARAAYLIKHPFCVYCLRDAGIPISDDAVAVGMACLARGIGLPLATVVDHSVPHRGDMTLFWDSSLWQSLCATHHSRDKQREEVLGM